MKRNEIAKKVIIWMQVLLLCAGVVTCFPLTAVGQETVSSEISLDRPALELLPGDTDTLYVKSGDKNGTVVWQSSDNAVVTVSAAGQVTARGVGQATVTATVGGKRADCTVYVVEKRHNVFTDNITVSTFWPPEGPDYIEEEQYKWMAEAGITYVMGAGANVGEKQDQLNMLSWCYKYGMQMMVGDDRMGPNMMYMSEEELAALLAEYKNVPGVSGWWLIDEPGYALDLVNAYVLLKKLAPEQEVYLNFLPGSGAEYCNSVEDFLRVLRSQDCIADYYQYDSYNCYIESIDYTRQLDGLRNSWEIGKKNGVKQAAFILSTGHASYRQTNENEIRWQMNSSLAFGAKLIQYFTWFCPSSFAVEGAQLGIVNYDGKKTPLYEGVSRVNHETLAIGETLINLDVMDVRVSGSHYDHMPITDDFPLTSDYKNELIASFMRNPETKRNYLMLVNNETAKTNTMSVVLDDRIGELTLIDNGTNQTYSRDGQTLTVTAKPGEAFLFALPEGLDLYLAASGAKDGENLSAYGYAYADSTVSSDSTAISNVNDGERFQTLTHNGWVSENKTADLTLDFGKAYSFNRADLYPAGFGERYGDNMPKDFELQVSDNGTDWKTVKTVTNYGQDGLQAPSFTFDTVKTRYFRIHVSDATENGIGLNEVEVYLDDGTLPPPEAYTLPVQTLGENIAPQAYVTATASTEAYGWSLEGINDGYRSFTYENTSEGYSNDGVIPCYVTFDFGITRKMDTIKMYPALNTYVNNEYMNYYPADFSFEVSDDGENWTTVYEVTDYEHKKKTKAFEIKFETVEARYLRWSMTKTRYSSVCVGEIQVFWNVPGEEQTEPDTEPITELVTEPATETVTDDVTETVTESAQTQADTETIAETNETDTQANAAGCTSAVISMIAVMAVVVGAVTVRKKEDG